MLVADHQTAGRGRLGRTWTAPPGASLLVSVLVRPPHDAHAHGAMQAGGLAARAACVAVAGVAPELKWPNDLYASGRKLAGVLAEGVIEHDRLASVVLGTGINVNWPPLDELPDDLRDRLVALNHLTGSSVERSALLDAYLDELGRRLVQWEQDPAGLLAAYHDALGTIGQRVRADLGTHVVTGTASGITTEGALLVLTEDGDEVVVSAGDVMQLRPAD